MNLWKHASRWLGNAPIEDEVDRRNAPVMQLLMLCYGLLLPASWVWRIAARGAIAPDMTNVLLIDLLAAMTALVSLVLIRRGRFRPAIAVFLVMLLASLEASAVSIGDKALQLDPVTPMLMMIISGLVLGRSALWAAFGLLMVVVATGFSVNVAIASDTGESLLHALRNVPSRMIIFLIIVTVLDRSIQALRESLAESNARGRELQREMAERERAQARLVHSQKMEAAGRLASGISHDFNNLLDVILGYAGQRQDIPDIREQGARERAYDRALEGVEVAAGRGAAITRKLLSFSRHDTPHPQVFDAGQALGELRPMLRQLFPRTVRLELPESFVDSPVRLDRSEFEMMALNLAANARDAMPGGGLFRIDLARTADGFIELALADSGHGMSATLQQRIFEPFFSTKAAADGTGLGLAVIRELVEATGGDIRVESAPDQGSTFRVRLPLAG